MTNTRGQIAMMPEKMACYCSDPKPHWHAYESVFDGDKWLPVTSQAGIEVITQLREEARKR